MDSNNGISNCASGSDNDNSCPPPPTATPQSVSVGEDMLGEAYKKYYKMAQVNEKGNFTVICQLCPPTKTKPLAVSKNSTHNMKLHIERKHHNKRQELIDEIEKCKLAKKRGAINQSGGTAPKQSLLQSKDGKLCSATNLSTGKDIDEALVWWIVDGAHSFNEVDRQSFKNLWSKLTHKKLMCSKTLLSKIDTAFTNMLEENMKELASVEYVCATADCWSANHKSFLAMTCHWIDPSTNERRNISLSCKRIKGAHTYDVIAKEIHQVLLSYKIQNKVSYMITDSGSNFLKAFREFGESETNDEEGDVDFQHVMLTETLENNSESVEGLSLPPHRKCAAHLLNLVATTDIEKRVDHSYKKISRAAFAKCQALWNKSRQSPKANDTVREHLGVNLIVPNATRWNSMHTSVAWLCKFLKELNDDRLHRVCDELGLPRLKPEEVDFLKEYVDVMEPLSKSLNILQGDRNISVGYLLPTIYCLLDKIKLLIQRNLTYCTPLAKAIKESVQARFEDDLWNEELVCASCLHPRFKLAWIDQDHQKDEARRLIENLLRTKYPPRPHEEEPTRTLESALEDDIEDESTKDFFNFKDSSAADKTWQEELDSFLSDSLKPFKDIKRYPLLDQLSLKLNTAIPSSAPVERLFSFGKDICTAKRGRLNDNNIEKQLLLKYNKK